MKDFDAEILSLIGSLGSMEEGLASEVRHYVEVGEHGIALSHLVAWVVGGQGDNKASARLERLVELGGFPEDLQRLQSYRDALGGSGFDES